MNIYSTTNMLILLLAWLGVVNGDPYKDGQTAGEVEFDKILDGYEQDCANAPDVDDCVCDYVWGLEDDCADLVRDYNYPGRGPLKKAFKMGFESVVWDMVDIEEETCFDNPDICDGLGQSAASIIVNRYCGAKGGHKGTQFKENCRATAINICKGAIKPGIDNAHPNCSAGVTNTVLLDLMNDCTPCIDCLLELETDNDVCECVLYGNCT